MATIKALLPTLLLAALVLAWGPAAPASAQEYVIGARDVLKITVWGQDDLSKEYPVDPDGYVSFPLIGRVKATGLTPTAFAGELRTRLEKDYLVNPQVLVSVREYLSQKVHVSAEAGTLRLNVARVLAGDSAENVQVGDGDTLVVPKGNTFFVFGEVKKPGAYQL